MPRHQLLPEDLRSAENVIVEEMQRQLKKKGHGSFISRHEILGVAKEEWDEVGDAVHNGTCEEIRKELSQLAVTCLIGIASIDRGMEW